MASKSVDKVAHPQRIREKSAANENFTASFFIMAIFLSPCLKLGQVVG